MSATCGTYGGYQAHRLADEDACADCRAAAAAYQRDYRATHPSRLRDSQAVQAARGRAMRRLAKRYPKEFQALVREERMKT